MAMNPVDTDFRDHHVREKTFKTWRIKRPAIKDVAKAGFIQTGPGDKVQCYACGVELNKWTKGDNPMQRHIAAAPACPLVEEWIHNVDDDIASVASGATASSADSGIEQDIQHVAPSKMLNHLPMIAGSSPSSVGSTLHLPSNRTSTTLRDPSPPPIKYKQIEERTKTFLGVQWPVELDAQPEKLVKAGFYYIGPGDRVKCGYCGGKLKHWRPDDSAIEKHVKHFPDCSFVKTIEKQTVVLAKNIRSKSKKASCISSEELIRRAAEEREKNKKSTPVQLHKKTLRKMGYKKSFIHRAHKQLSIKHAPLDLHNLLSEVQLIEKVSFLGNLTLSESSDSDEGLSSETEEDVMQTLIESKENTDDRVKRLQRELRSVQNETDELTNHMTCKVCLSSKVDTLFLTCRHFVTCKDCADRVRDCPICREVILGTVDVFMAEHTGTTPIIV